MELDYSSGATIFAGAIVFPEWTFTDQPRNEPLVERIYLTGGAQGTIYVTGTPDQDE